MSEQKRKRKWGDRKDGRWVKEATGMQIIMANLLKNRTDCEVYLNETIDITELLKYLEKKNEGKTEEKMTLFHCFVTSAVRMVKERPYMNRFVQGGRIYERNEISASFTMKRRFTDHAEEALMKFIPKDTDTVNEISKAIIGEVHETRKSEHSTDGVDKIMDTLAGLPRWLLRFIVWVVLKLDYYGKVPRAITDTDPNFSTIFLSNLGSIKCPAVYHHLNNYGTNSMMITIGVMRKEQMLMPDGTMQIRDVLDIGATLDERIGDGFYFARSLKLIKYIFANPELLERPLGEPSGFDYK